eukprot:5610400-Pyramimonas_sp.AAC.1
MGLALQQADERWTPVSLQDAPESDGLAHDEEEDENGLLEEDDDMLIPADDLQVSQFDAGFGWGPSLGNTGTGEDLDVSPTTRACFFIHSFLSHFPFGRILFNDGAPSMHLEFALCCLHRLVHELS